MVIHPRNLNLGERIVRFAEWSPRGKQLVGLASWSGGDATPRAAARPSTLRSTLRSRTSLLPWRQARHPSKPSAPPGLRRSGCHFPPPVSPAPTDARVQTHTQCTHRVTTGRPVARSPPRSLAELAHHRAQPPALQKARLLPWPAVTSWAPARHARPHFRILEQTRM